jgi:hypothetical protein
MFIFRVYEVERGGRHYALKRVLAKNFDEREYETSLLVRGKSKYVVQVYEKRELGKEVYILMELINGGVCYIIIMK